MCGCVCVSECLFHSLAISSVFIIILTSCLHACLQGLVLGVFEKEGEEGSLHLTEAAAGFDQTLSGKLSELLKM